MVQLWPGNVEGCKSQQVGREGISQSSNTEAEGKWRKWANHSLDTPQKVKEWWEQGGKKHEFVKRHVGISGNIWKLFFSGLIRPKMEHFGFGTTSVTFGGNLGSSLHWSLVVVAWWCGDVFLSTGTGKMGKVDGKMNGANYRAILEERLFQFPKDLQLGQSSKNPKHTAKATPERFKINNLTMFKQANQSPDLNLIGDICRLLMRPKISAQWHQSL